MFAAFSDAIAQDAGWQISLLVYRLCLRVQDGKFADALRPPFAKIVPTAHLAFQWPVTVQRWAIGGGG